SSASPVPPPPLSGQRDAPDLLRSLLFKSGTTGRLHDALAIVWETGLYKKDIAHYGTILSERVHLGASSVLGDVYSAAARLLDVGKTGLFQHRAASSTGASFETRIVMIWPPALVFTGEAREDSAELRYAVGSGLAGAMAEHVLVNALDEEQLR